MQFNGPGGSFQSSLTVDWHLLVGDESALGAIGATLEGLPAGSFDVFVHGEAGEVRSVRTHLVNEREIDVSVASISPYWRRKHTDEAWRKVKRHWLSEEACAPA